MFNDNRVTKLLGIEYPIIQGGMAWVADADLAAAVSNGGGLGIIAAANVPPDLLEQQILRARSLTAHPFGLNIMLLSRPVGAAGQGTAKPPLWSYFGGAPGAFACELLVRSEISVESNSWLVLIFIAT